ncbi:hypothetical protein GKC56_05910 [Neisseriaceae bacterium PsAf]|nr:hypothetical protein [Neisseriaceae bacterium PsAf]
MIYKTIQFLTSLMIVIFSNFAFTNPITTPEENYHNVLQNYQDQLKVQKIKHQLLDTIKTDTTTIYKYNIQSQIWSPNNLVVPNVWSHEVKIFAPKHANLNYVIIFACNGTNHGQNIRYCNEYLDKDITDIVNKTNLIVATISNIPNQPLQFNQESDNLVEDDAVARSWQLFLDNPKINSNLPLHIPMAASISKTITFLQEEFPLQNSKFIVAGASKRAAAAWLSALTDPRIISVVALVFDFLNTSSVLEHIYKTYGNNWPVTFYPFYQAGLIDQFNSDNFKKLMQVEDPFTYSKNKLSNIKKYVINASGDEFFVPDGSQYYYSQLPGEKILRMLPNAGHHQSLNYVASSIIPFINRN